jgi:hypothetical protein
MAQNFTHPENVSRKPPFPLHDVIVRPHMSTKCVLIGISWKRVDDIAEQNGYQPTPRGLEGKIAEKLAHLKKLDEEAGKE